jgi:chemotaxis protein methyltransferase CheR
VESDFDQTQDFAEFKACVQRKSGIDLNLYKQQQMHRRLLNQVERAGTSSFMEYFRYIDQREDEYTSFLDRITINVSELFRNPEKWKDLREHILPSLLNSKKSLTIWSACCSYGAEPYSLAILLDQMGSGTAHKLFATDLDRRIIARAREGWFSTADTRNIDASDLMRYFIRQHGVPDQRNDSLPETPPLYQVKPLIRSRVRFYSHNLLSDNFESQCDLICCRNVVIYFTDAAKDRLFERFYRALAPGGILFVGGTERIARAQEIGFDSTVPFFYRRKN